MLDINESEYKLLKKLKSGKTIEKDKFFYSLKDKGYVKDNFVMQTENETFTSGDIEVTPNGTTAYENYRETHNQIKWASIRSWIAIAISAIALAFSIFVWIFG